MKNLYPKITYLLLYFLCWFPGGIVEAQSFQWASFSKGKENQFGRDIAVDATGNIYITGDFQGSISFDSYTLQSKGERDIFLVKYNADGKVLWAIRAGGNKDDFGNSVGVDQAGNIYLTGSFISQQADFNTIVLTNTEPVVDAISKDLFLAKYSAEGEVLWAQSAKGNSTQEGLDLAIDAAGNVYVSGTYFFGLSISGASLYNDGHQSGMGVTSDLFVLKFNPSGNLQFAVSSTGSGFETAYGIAVDAAQNIYLTGYYVGAFSLDHFSLQSNWSSIPSQARPDGFITKINAAGKVQWVSKFGGKHDDIGYKIGVDAEGNSYVTGKFDNTALFDTISLTSDLPSSVPKEFVGDDIFVAKYSTTGNIVWARRAGGYNGSEVGNSIAVDVEGNSYITGSFTTVSIAEEKRPTFGDFSLSSCGLDDIFICQYNKDGNVVKVAKAGGNWSDIGLGIAINQAGCCFVTGYFKSFTALFGSLPVMATGQANVFVTKLDHAQWQYASVNISAKSNQYCRQNSFPVDFTLTCTSFPFNPEVSIEISEVNSSVFPSSPIIIGKGDTSPVQCQFPAYMPAGKYTLRAKVLGLAQTNIAEVILQEQNNSLSIQMGSTQVCADHEVTFTAIPLVEGNKPVYTWRLNGVTQNSSSRTLSLKIPLTDIEQLMKIEVEMSSPGNCNLYAQQTLNVLPLPGLSCSLPEEIVANTKAAFTASASGGQPPYTYFWDFGDEQTLQGDHNPEVTHTYIHNGSYRVVTTVTDNKGCTSKCINTIQVQLNLDSLPNVFTPNGDFVNDRFTMNYNGREPFEMLIYNRWGKLVAQTISGLEGWDGMGCATGVYYYSIRVGSRKRKGWIQLLR